MPLFRALRPPAALVPLPSAAREAFHRIAQWCLRCHDRARQRRSLRELDPHLLRDIGVTRSEALAESAKPWWRA
jgi:uncharacterized protein YjiS (DUF1127 family)